MAILLEQMSPAGDVAAIIEDDGRTVSFYLQFLNASEPAERIKACWVRNLMAAPPNLDRDSMLAGTAPLLDAAFCKHPKGLPSPKADSLHLVWFEEGDGAALYEDDELLAIIPSWSGQGEFHGYSRDCVGESSICWGLPTGPDMFDRIKRAAEYWAMWDDELFWTRFRDGLVQPIENAFGRPADKYYAIDGGKWPPKAMLRFNFPDRQIITTVGVSIQPQPRVESHTDDASARRRIELGGAMDGTCPESEFKRVGAYISGQSTYPWSRGTWLGEGHTMPCDSVPPSLGGLAFNAVLFTFAPGGVAAINLPSFRGDRINLLWMIPIYARERDFAEEQGSPKLFGRLSAAGVGVVHRNRASVV